MDRNDIMVLVGWAILLIGIAAMSLTVNFDISTLEARMRKAVIAAFWLIIALVGMAVIINYGLKAKP